MQTLIETKNEHRLKSTQIKLEKENGLKTGFSKLDKCTNGFIKGQLTILAGRFGMGKSTFSINLVKNIVSYTEKNVVVFSLAYSKKQWLNIFSRIQLDPERPVRNEKDLTLALDNLFIDDSERVSAVEIMEKVGNTKTHIDLLVIDYLQLIVGTDGKKIKDNNYKDIVRLFKVLAKTLNIPIVLVSNIDRKIDKKSIYKKMPKLEFLDDFGFIQDHAEVVILLHKYEYYGDSVDKDGVDLRNITDLTIAKNRNGYATGIWFKHNIKTGTFTEYSIYDDNHES